MLKVLLEVAAPDDILNRYFPNGKMGGLTVDGMVPGALGQRVELTVKVARPPREFNLLGQLAWARHRNSRGLKECFGIDFLVTDESSQRLLGFARQDLGPEALRGTRRLETNLPVKLTHQGKTRKEFLADLSFGGAFVRSGTPLPAGEQVELHLRPPLSLLGIPVSARVAWVRQTGTEPGMGLQFLDDDAKVREKIAKLLEKLERS